LFKLMFGRSIFSAPKPSRELPSVSLFLIHSFTFTPPVPDSGWDFVSSS
jgi:hypothetical protein